MIEWSLTQGHGHFSVSARREHGPNRRTTRNGPRYPHTLQFHPLSSSDTIPESPQDQHTSSTCHRPVLKCTRAPAVIFNDSIFPQKASLSPWPHKTRSLRGGFHTQVFGRYGRLAGEELWIVATPAVGPHLVDWYSSNSRREAPVASFRVGKDLPRSFLSPWLWQMGKGSPDFGEFFFPGGAIPCRTKSPCHVRFYYRHGRRHHPWKRYHQHADWLPSILPIFHLLP